MQTSSAHPSFTTSARTVSRERDRSHFAHLAADMGIRRVCVSLCLIRHFQLKSNTQTRTKQERHHTQGQNDTLRNAQDQWTYASAMDRPHPASHTGHGGPFVITHHCTPRSYRSPVWTQEATVLEEAHRPNHTQYIQRRERSRVTSRTTRRGFIAHGTECNTHGRRADCASWTTPSCPTRLSKPSDGCPLAPSRCSPVRIGHGWFVSSRNAFFHTNFVVSMLAIHTQTHEKHQTSSWRVYSRTSRVRTTSVPYIVPRKVLCTDDRTVDKKKGVFVRKE